MCFPSNIVVGRDRRILVQVIKWEVEGGNPV